MKISSPHILPACIFLSGAFYLLLYIFVYHKQNTVAWYKTSKYFVRHSILPLVFINDLTVGFFPPPPPPSVRRRDWESRGPPQPLSRDHGLFFPSVSCLGRGHPPPGVSRQPFLHTRKNPYPSPSDEVIIFWVSPASFLCRFRLEPLAGRPRKPAGWGLILAAGSDANFL